MSTSPNRLKGTGPTATGLRQGPSEKRLVSGLLCAFLSGLAACGPSALPSAPTSTIQPWLSPTPSVTPSPPQGTPVSVATPAPSPTPLTYTVQTGDTLLGIAAHYGISLDALKAANPGVQERFLGIGQKLTIPIAIPTEESISIPTPVALDLSPARCFLTPTGAEWCLALVTNPGPSAVEDVTVEFTLLDQDGLGIASRSEPLPLGLLPAGGAMPAAAFFTPQEAKSTRAEVSLTGAVPASSSSERFLPVEILQSEVLGLEGGLAVRVQARVRSDQTASAEHVRALLVLYGAAGEVIGFRTEVLDQEWKPGEVHTLVVRAYSLGGAIADHAFFMEANP